ncbi:ABC transporter ATP-binding protein [Alienimonas chondri]|uniref:Vitamin B12 import ATP-binding protein BtuD n=1 Tax=Alienimonas chondri TaxID=2681879 RepID=A0ABX1VC81_9PLAN|nr:ABC transporter ATP-binding protein [Alienimonas chondri]NNJ25324.1 Vitamin B12 import ATP-binding protein BtuD [Alienimonas chondri]
MPSPVLRVDGLGKRYDLGLTHAGSLAAVASRWTRRLRGLPPEEGSVLTGTHAADDQSSSFWALKDVSFEVGAGEVVGIIGRNGAGKSTLLKILSRVTAPTTGSVEIDGRVGSLLEVGTGFHPELTGRENVYMNATLLGMSKREVDAKLDEIVDFSGVERFLDTPVKRYSSGMKVRLGFAVAAHLEPELLIIDEVLAVGDAEFQSRCLGRMKTVAGEGRTVLFVSHNMAAIRTLCPRSLWMEQGLLRASGETAALITEYIAQDAEVLTAERAFEINEEKDVQLLSAEAVAPSGEKSAGLFECDDPLAVRLTLLVRRPVPRMYGYLEFVSDRAGTVLVSDSHDCPPNPLDGLAPGVHVVDLNVPPRTLGVGEYSVYFNLASPAADGFDVDSPGNLIRVRLTDPATRRGDRRGGCLSTLVNWSVAPSPATVAPPISA